MNGPTTSADVRTPPQPISWPPGDGGHALTEVQALCTTALRLQEQRHGIALVAAQKAGYGHGERVGFVQGWVWGAACGAIASVTVLACLALGSVLWQDKAPSADQLQQLLAGDDKELTL